MKKKARILKLRKQEASGPSSFLDKIRTRLHSRAEKKRLFKQLKLVREQHERARAERMAKASRVIPLRRSAKERKKAA